MCLELFCPGECSLLSFSSCPLSQTFVKVSFFCIYLARAIFFLASSFWYVFSHHFNLSVLYVCPSKIIHSWMLFSKFSSSCFAYFLPPFLSLFAFVLSSILNASLRYLVNCLRFRVGNKLTGGSEKVARAYQWWDLL